MFLYTGLALTPPFLMQMGLEGVANAIYTLYSPMCHQFAFRSLFFFGDQVTYPREIAGADSKSFEYYAIQDAHFDHIEELTAWSPELQIAARSFKGNEQMGYKTALCERDVAIYGMMFLMGLLFARVRHWLRPASLWLYLMLGLVPLGLDGFSQMFSYPPFEFWPVRETIPAYRILTGALFGLMNVWLAFPYLESSMRETMAVMGERLEMAQQLLKAVHDEK
ncbi:MAG: DUF2085 domain-containing protein [Chloroflexi bacterium]|nr:DUF2085 domain-containing protein [Chloroflexota bacterium]